MLIQYTLIFQDYTASCTKAVTNKLFLYRALFPHPPAPNNQLHSRQAVVFGSELIHLETEQATSPIMKGAESDLHAEEQLRAHAANQKCS